MATDRGTAYRWDDQRTHALFRGSDSALTLCGKRALEQPGRGAIDCPECLEALTEGRKAQEQAGQAVEQCDHCGHYRVNGEIVHADWCRHLQESGTP